MRHSSSLFTPQPVLQPVELLHLRSPTTGGGGAAEHTNNLSKWAAFGVNVSSYTQHTHPAPTDNTIAQAEAHGGSASRVASLAMRADEERRTRSSLYDPEKQWCSILTTSSSADKSAASASSRSVLPNLCEAQAPSRMEEPPPPMHNHSVSALSAKVREAEELVRCGPPKPSSSSSSSSSRRINHPFTKRKTSATEEEKQGESATRSKSSSARRGARAHDVGASVVDDDASPAQRKTRKRGASSPSGGGRSKQRGADAQTTHLFRPEVPSQQRTIFSMTSAEAASATNIVAAQTPYTILADTSSLVAALRRTLDDPERIHMPTLFVGIAFADQHTNFMLSTQNKSRAIVPVGIHPRNAHSAVRAVCVRWMDEVYILSSAEVGLAFLVKVLSDFPGVELITYNAPTVLLVLLAFTSGVVHSTSISDVRVMGWMCSMASASPDGSDGDTVGCGNTYAALHLLMSGNNNSNNGDVVALAPPLTSSTVEQTLANHVSSLAPLYRTLYGQLGAKGLLQAFIRQEKRTSLLLAMMKYNGCVLQLAEVERLRLRCEEVMEMQGRRAVELVGTSMPAFNVQSHEHCRHMLYDVLHLDHHLFSGEDGSGINTTTTKSGKLSTAEDALRVLAKHHELPRCIMAYRKAAKLLQTYVEGMLPWALPCDASGNPSMVEENIFADDAPSSSIISTTYATLHPNFIHDGTDTGRLSCAEPNMQNLPRGATPLTDTTSASTAMLLEQLTDEDAAFRRCFVAPAGMILISIDYEQIELRVLAHLSEDPDLVQLLSTSADIHAGIAQSIFQCATVSAEQRSLAKRVVFGVLYGAGPRAIAAQVGVSVERAMDVASRFRQAFPHMQHFHRRVVEQCRMDGCVRTLSGRFRQLPDINSGVMAKRAYAERQAFNSIIQGSAADVMKLGMMEVHRNVLSKRGPDEIRLLLQVHDELVVAVREDVVREVVPQLSQAMSQAISLLVPLRVSVKVGRNLADLTSWTVDHDLGVEMV